jgi:hypothetical protein
MLEKILVVNIVNINLVMLIACKDILRRSECQDGDHVGDVGSFKSRFVFEAKDARKWGFWSAIQTTRRHGPARGPLRIEAIVLQDAWR